MLFVMYGMLFVMYGSMIFSRVLGNVEGSELSLYEVPRSFGFVMFY